MNRNEFDNLVLALARAVHPQQRWAIQNGQLISRSANGERIEHSLAHMYTQAPRDSSVRDWIKARLAVMQNIWAELEYGDWTTEQANVYPLLRPASFLTHIEQQRARIRPEQALGLPACVFMWHGDLCVSAVLNRPETMTYVYEQQLADWQVSAETVCEQAKVNLAHRGGQVLLDRTRCGTLWAQIEPMSYTAAYALLPSFHLILANALGPRFQILLPAENMLIAHTAADPWADADFVAGLHEAIREDGDPAHLLALTGALNVDLLVGTALWQALPEPSSPGRDAREQRRYLLN